MNQPIETAEAAGILPIDDIAPEPRGHLSIARDRFLRHRVALAGLVILTLMVLAALFAPVLAPYGEDQQDLFAQLQGPTSAHLLGTDSLGRDVLTLLLYGGRVSLSIGLAAALISMVIGVLVGAVSGFFGGWIDNIMMRLVDLLLAFPAIFLLLIMFSIIQGSAFSVTIFLGAFGWLYLARIIRGEFLSLREKDFVDAARALGVPRIRMIVKHMLPNVVAAIIVTTTLNVAYNMIAEATLDFLGYGVPPDVPTWGNMLTGAEEYYISVPLLAVVPGVTLTIAILAINFVGDGLRDALDPRAGR
ncbi:MAG TPA: ABC transporter permease [Chloroflexota bacterium]|nr:ABC transporter permease [Chloroflexota bacterium]